MSVNFSESACQDKTSVKLFGLCDDDARPQERAYLNEHDGATWIAVVHNDEGFEVTFTAIDNCIETLRADGKMDSRCDGMLTYNTSIVFVELKERGGWGKDWIKEGDVQLRTSIGYFEANADTERLTGKRALLANSEHPRFRDSQIGRMERFRDETKYVLRIANRIHLT